ncbi:hypothetical protein KY289_000613 [Solanum tuberosum]|nr:hypothetical protein KY289_000613 [Solanum tuberosum]
MHALSLPDSTYHKEFNQTPAQTRSKVCVNLPSPNPTSEITLGCCGNSCKLPYISDLSPTRTAYMDTSVLATSKDPKDLKQIPAQSRNTFIHFLLTRYACVSVTLYNSASLIAYLDANVHTASMDTKDLKQTPTKYSLSITRTPAIDANQLSGMDPTEHTQNPSHSRTTSKSRGMGIRTRSKIENQLPAETTCPHKGLHLFHKPRRTIRS